MSGQVRNCDTTPAEHVFTNSELVELVSKANVLRENPPAPVAIPHFVSLHKIFLVACLLCLFHNEGYCASIAIQRTLDDCQISLEGLRKTSLCDDCLRRSKCCPYCISINKEISLEKKRENSLLLNSIVVKSDSVTGQKFLSVNYPLKVDPLIAYHPSKSNYSHARQNSIRLRNKLLKLELLDSFDEQISSDIQAEFCTILRGKQVTEILSRTH